MRLRLDEGRDKSKDVVNQDNPDGQRPPEMASGGPKHGKWDGQEHIGGNQFAGGSGGTGTAGRNQRLDFMISMSVSLSMILMIRYSVNAPFLDLEVTVCISCSGQPA